MEMYADVESRGGILEPPGICEVKFRAADQLSKMHAVSSDAPRVVNFVMCSVAMRAHSRLLFDRKGAVRWEWMMAQ